MGKDKHPYTKMNKSWWICTLAKSLEDLFVLRTSRIVNSSPKCHWDSWHQTRKQGTCQEIIMGTNNQIHIGV